MRLSLVIATRRRPELLRETLESLAATDPPPHELLVVDGDEDRSAQPVVEAFAAAHPALATRYMATDPGSSYQRNRGMEAASGDVVVFADDDVLFDRRVFAALARVYDDPTVVAATGRAEEPGVHRVAGGRTRLRRLLGGEEGRMTRFGYPRRIVDPGTPRDVEFLHGCLMSARRDVGLDVRFDEAMGGYALAEDEDFGYRLSRVGRVRYVPDAAVVHKNVGFGTYDSRAFNRKLAVNRAHLFRKNFPRTPLARAQFAGMMLLLGAHRAANLDWRGVAGLAEGSWEAWRQRN